MAKIKNFGKDQLVYTRKRWGAQAGEVDEEQLYKIRSIGPKQCTLVRVNKETGLPSWLGRSGQNVYLYNKEEAEAYNRANSERGYHGIKYWEWSQYLVPISQAGWDPDQNW